MSAFLVENKTLTVLALQIWEDIKNETEVGKKFHEVATYRDFYIGDVKDVWNLLYKLNVESLVARYGDDPQKLLSKYPMRENISLLTFHSDTRERYIRLIHRARCYRYQACEIEDDHDLEWVLKFIPVFMRDWALTIVEDLTPEYETIVEDDWN